MAVSTCRRVCWLTPGRSLRTRLTVLTLTPARAAISLSLMVTRQNTSDLRHILKLFAAVFLSCKATASVWRASHPPSDREEILGMLKLARTIGPAILALVLVAGCGSDDGGDDPGATDEETSAAPSDDASETGAPERDANADLVIWTDSLKLEAVQTVADQFAEANGISVAVQAVSTDLQTNFVTANAAKNGPDVVVGAHDWIGNLVQNGAIVPLQLSPEVLSGYSTKAVEARRYDGQLYGVPYGIEAIALYRNTEVAPDEPKTFDDAVDAGLKAVKDGKVESALNLPVGDTGDPYHMEPILTSMGGYIFAYDEATGYDANDVGIGKEGSIRAAEKISELGKQKVLRTSISGDNSIALFTEGKAAFLVSGPWALPDVQKAGFEYAIQPIPGFAGEGPAEP